MDGRPRIIQAQSFFIHLVDFAELRLLHHLTQGTVIIREMTCAKSNIVVVLKGGVSRMLRLTAGFLLTIPRTELTCDQPQVSDWQVGLNPSRNHGALPPQ